MSEQGSKSFPNDTQKAERCKTMRSECTHVVIAGLAAVEVNTFFMVDVTRLVTDLICFDAVAPIDEPIGCRAARQQGKS